MDRIKLHLYDNKEDANNVDACATWMIMTMLMMTRMMDGYDDDIGDAYDDGHYHHLDAYDVDLNVVGAGANADTDADGAAAGAGHSDQVIDGEDDNDDDDDNHDAEDVDDDDDDDAAADDDEDGHDEMRVRIYSRHHHTHRASAVFSWAVIMCLIALADLSSSYPPCLFPCSYLVPVILILMLILFTIIIIIITTTTITTHNHHHNRRVSWVSALPEACRCFVADSLASIVLFAQAPSRNSS